MGLNHTKHQVMKKIFGIVQTHMFSKEDLQQLEAGLKAVYQENYKAEELMVIWRVMAKGFAYSERKLSNALVLLMEVEETIGQEKREQLLFAASNYLLDNFNISPLDAVITAPNASYVNAFMEAQQSQMAA